MAGVSSLGIGSGLDLSSLVDQLVTAQRSTSDTRLNATESRYNSQLSAFGLLRSSISSFKSSFSALSSQDNFFQQTASVSDPEILSVSAESDAAAISAKIDVQTLAKNHSLASQSFASINETLDPGDITISFGTTDYVSGTDTYNSFTLNPLQATRTITVSAANDNNTLSGLRDYINENDFGVKANIVNDGSGYRLLLSSNDSGLENSMQVNVSDMGGNLASFAFNGTATNMDQTVAAQDAQFTIDGLLVTSASNTVTDAIEGLSLSLTKASPGTEVTLNVSLSTDTAKSSIEEFVNSYNALVTNIGKLSGYDAATETAGILIGDASVRTIQSGLRRLITSPIEQLNGNVQSLVDIGISTQADGKLSINSSKLDALLNSNPSSVAAVFSSSATPSDSQVVFNAATSSTKAGSYAVNITQLSTQGVVNGDSVLPGDFSLAPLVINAGNDSLTIKLDGVSSAEVLIPPGSYNDGDTLAAVIQSQINADTALSEAGTSVLVTYDSANNRFDVTSARYGSASKVEFVNVDGSSATDLGFAAGPGTDGVDVTGTINGLSATGNGQKLSSDLGDSKGLSLNITAGTTGARGTVDFSTGFISSLVSQVDSLLADNGVIDARENGLQSSIDDIGEQRTTLNSRMVTYEARLVAQFSAMDALVASLQTTGNFLSSQLANLPGAISLNRNR